jgi:predicted 2-oxoglutarate/Fe(II)-dependent dioxygenase YbiX
LGRWRAMEVNVFKNVFTTQELDSFKTEAIELLKKTKDVSDDNLTHCVSINRQDIVDKVKNFLENKLNITLHCHDIQYQVWKVGSQSTPHVHDEHDRSICDYNTLIYLNDDFNGGEFYTLNEIIPVKKGNITFFNGEKIWHGVKPVKKNHRYTIIIWWFNSNVSNNCNR